MEIQVGCKTLPRVWAASLLAGTLVRELVLSLRGGCEAGLEMSGFEEATWLSNLMQTGLALAPT